jgi:hypothetical protein
MIGKKVLGETARNHFGTEVSLLPFTRIINSVNEGRTDQPFIYRTPISKKYQLPVSAVHSERRPRNVARLSHRVFQRMMSKS